VVRLTSSNKWQLDSKTEKVTSLSPGRGTLTNKSRHEILVSRTPAQIVVLTVAEARERSTFFQQPWSCMHELSGAETIFGQGEQDRDRQNRERETEVYAGIGESFCPENKRKGVRRIRSIFLARKHRFSKKDLRRILERFLVLNMAHDTGLRGGKSRPGVGGSCPPTSRAYA